jgi:hypothetical protein
MFLPARKATPRSDLPGESSSSSFHAPRSELHPKSQVRPTLCRSAVWAPPSRRCDSTPMPLRRPDPLQRLVGRPPRGGRFRHSLPCALLGGDIRVVAPMSVDGRPPSRIHLHPAERQHEHAECEQAKYPTAERRKHRLSICVTRAFRTAVAEATWSAQRLAVKLRACRTHRAHDDTTISLRQDRQLQRLVRRPFAA